VSAKRKNLTDLAKRDAKRFLPAISPEAGPAVLSRLEMLRDYVVLGWRRGYQAAQRDARRKAKVQRG
jgi:hypothetical protein